MTDAAAPAAPVAPAPARVQSPLRRIASEFFESPLAAIGLVLVVAIALAAVFAPWIVPQNPYDLSRLDIMDGTQPPGAEAMDGMVFWLGSDVQGRDMLSAIVYGLRMSLIVAGAVTGIALAIGLAFGIAAAYFGGRVDTVIMRIVDLQLSFPAILIALVAVQWAYYARTVRGAALVERRKDYIAAARCLALGHSRVMFRHLLPNCMPPLIVVATVQVANAIALEATLSFLGVGVPITEPSLGLLIANGYSYLLSGKYWISVFPGIALVVTIVAINLVGDRLRDVLNPRLAR